LIQFLQTLGGAVGLSVLASLQATRFAALDPSPSPACLSPSPPVPLCGGFLGSLQVSLVSSYDQVFTVMVGLLVVALVFVLFLNGRLPKVVPAGESATAQGVTTVPSVAAASQDQNQASPSEKSTPSAG
jgi:hypothetical protein